MHASRAFEFRLYMEYNICRKVLIDVTDKVYTFNEIKEIAYPIVQRCKAIANASAGKHKNTVQPCVEQ